VLIDGMDLRDLGQRNLRSVVTVVPQDPVLFDATVRENLLYGDPSATSRELEQVVSLAQLHDVIRKLPRGLDEPLDRWDESFPGVRRRGWRWLARFCSGLRFFILDEVTSALDGPTAARMLEALDHFRQGRSVVLISHKPSAISWADRIVVLDKAGS